MYLPLLILYFGRKIMGKVRFQKLVFLCKAEENVDTDYSFDLHKFGPFSSQLSSDLDELILTHALVNVDEVDLPPLDDSVRVLNVYRLTDRGQSFVRKELLGKVEHESEIRKVVERFNHLPLEKLLSYVYDNHVLLAET
jgi:uncharacterized protein YwgA